MESAIAAASAISNVVEKIERLSRIFGSTLESNDVEQMKKFIDYMVSGVFPLVVSQVILKKFAQEIEEWGAEAQKVLGHYALDQIQIQPTVVWFEDVVLLIREKLADLYESKQQWSLAAQMLSGIDLDSGIMTVEDKLFKCNRIAFLYLQDYDDVNAEAFVKEASFLINYSQLEGLKVPHKVCCARLLEVKRKFLGAALHYYDIHQIKMRVLRDEMEHRRLSDESLDLVKTDARISLHSAVKSTILAAAGPRRTRLLAWFFQDEGCAELKIYPILRKVHLKRILSKSEIDAFSEELHDYQKALLPDNCTVVDRVMIEHNLICASKVYANISFEELGTLLGIAPEKAEKMASSMICDDRMRGSIDQVARLIHFDDDIDEVQQWDQQVLSVCESLNDIASSFNINKIIASETTNKTE